MLNPVAGACIDVLELGEVSFNQLVDRVATVLDSAGKMLEDELSYIVTEFVDRGLVDIR